MGSLQHMNSKLTQHLERRTDRSAPLRRQWKGSAVAKCSLLLCQESNSPVGDWRERGKREGDVLLGGVVLLPESRLPLHSYTRPQTWPKGLHNVSRNTNPRPAPAPPGQRSAAGQ